MRSLCKVTLIENCFAAVAELMSVTCTVKMYVPAALGVPEIMPVAPSSVKPGARFPDVMDHV
jgi:hypothetical protein